MPLHFPRRKDAPSVSWLRQAVEQGAGFEKDLSFVGGRVWRGGEVVEAAGDGNLWGDFSRKDAGAVVAAGGGGTEVREGVVD